jgi:hypothetical protein
MRAAVRLYHIMGIEMLMVRFTMQGITGSTEILLSWLLSSSSLSLSATAEKVNGGQLGVTVRLRLKQIEFLAVDGREHLVDDSFILLGHVVHGRTVVVDAHHDLGVGGERGSHGGLGEKLANKTKKIEG